MAKDTFTYTGTQTIQRPKESGKIPHGSFGDNALWITMKAIELKYQTTLSKGGGITRGKTGPTFKFLAPDAIQETIRNDWTPYENSVVNSLANKAITASKTIRDVQTMGTGIKNTLGDTAKRKELSSGKRAAYNQISSGLATQIPTEKIDSPLSFTNSSRREWMFLLNLISQNNPSLEVVEPVKDLMKYSSPEIRDWNIGIELPWIFELKTYPNELIICQFAALTSVQPTWQHPYIKGLPTRCELTLSFTDMSPLYRTTIKKGGVVRVVDENGKSVS